MITHAQVQAALEYMKRTEMLLDDFDYLTDSPRLQEAMKAAENFRTILEQYDEQQKNAKRP